MGARGADNTLWFYYKFLLIGALIGGVLAYYLKNDDYKVNERFGRFGRVYPKVHKISFFKVIEEEIFLVIITLAFIISVSIDIYISQNTIMTIQLGNWN